MTFGSLDLSKLKTPSASGWGSSLTSGGSSGGSGYGMNNAAAAGYINNLASSAPARAQGSAPNPSSPSNFSSLFSGSSTSSSFPTLANLGKTTGATGNTLYPAPKSTSNSNGGYPSLSGSWPTLTKQPGGITGGAGQSSTWKMPAPSWSNLGGSTTGTGGGSGAGGAGGVSLSSLKMPAGFSSSAFGQAGQTQPAGASSSGQQVGPGGVQANGRPWMGSAAQSQVTSGPMPGPDHSKSNAGSVSYYGGGQQTQSSVTGPGALKTGVPSAGTKQATDQWGRTFYYNNTGFENSNQPVAGVSNTGTVLRVAMNSDGTPFIGQDGKPYVYDTGVAAFTPKAPERTPGPVTPAVVATTAPAGPRPSAYIPAPKTAEELDAEAQGRLLQ